MSASIKLIYECPRCNESVIADSRPDTCPGCKFDFGGQGLVQTASPPDYYQIPYTLTEQHLRLQNTQAFNSFIMELPKDKANDILNDALSVIQLLAGKKAKVSDIRFLVQMGIQIGEVAKAYDNYLRSGGLHAPELLLPLSEREPNEPKQNRDGENAT